MSYQFWVYNPQATPAWSELQAESALNSCTWTPIAGGVYLLAATAQDGFTGREVTAKLWYGITSLSAVSVTASPASSQLAGSAITLTA